jgi:hypothetical protein
MLAVIGVLIAPVDVQSREFVLQDGQWTPQPCTLHTMLWAKVLWDNGYNLYYDTETGFAVDNAFPFHEQLEALGVPVF